MGADLTLLMEPPSAEEYSRRLWEAEALLERLNYVRGLDGRWRERPTADEAREMQQMPALAPDGDEWWVR